MSPGLCLKIDTQPEKHTLFTSHPQKFCFLGGAASDTPPPDGAGVRAHGVRGRAVRSFRRSVCGPGGRPGHRGVAPQLRPPVRRPEGDVAHRELARWLGNDGAHEDPMVAGYSSDRYAEIAQLAGRVDLFAQQYVRDDGRDQFRVEQIRVGVQPAPSLAPDRCAPERRRSSLARTKRRKLASVRPVANPARSEQAIDAPELIGMRVGVVVVSPQDGLCSHMAVPARDAEYLGRRSLFHEAIAFATLEVGA